MTSRFYYFRSLCSFLLTSLLVFSFLAGCSNEDVKTELRGQVESVLPAGLKVCQDVSENSSCDADEPATVTKDDGSFALVVPMASAGRYPILVEMPNDGTSANSVRFFAAQAGRDQLVPVDPKADIVDSAENEISPAIDQQDVPVADLNAMDNRDETNVTPDNPLPLPESSTKTFNNTLTPACTPIILFVNDVDQPSEVKAGSPATFKWEVINDSDCDAVNYHLGFDGTVPTTSSGDFGGEDHPSFTLYAKETGVVEAHMIAAPTAVGESFKVYYDIFRPDGTSLNDLPLGGLYAEFTVTEPDEPPPPVVDCTPTIVWRADGYQPGDLAPGRPVDLTWQVSNISSDCDAIDYHLGFFSANPYSPTADYGGLNHIPFTLLAGETGYVQANVVATPMEENSYKVSFDIYDNAGRPLPVPAGWERLYAEFRIKKDLPPPSDGCEGASPPVIQNARLNPYDDNNVIVTADVTDSTGSLTVTLELNGQPYPMSLLDSGLYGAIAPGHESGDNEFVVKAQNNCFPPDFELINEVVINSYYFGKGCQNNGKCDNSGRSDFAASEADPITSYTGNYTQSTIDGAVAGPGDADLFIQRDYNSLAAMMDPASTYQYSGDGATREKIAGPPQYFGSGWSSNLDSFLLVLDYAPLYEGVQIRFPDGHTQLFDKNGSTYEPSTPDNFDTLTTESGGYLLKRKHSLESWRFNANGHLIEISDRNGNAIAYKYSGDLLTEISVNSGSGTLGPVRGRAITFSHDANGHIVEARLPENIVFSYEYEDDLLVAMTDGRGNRTEYQYNGDKQLTEVIRPSGNPSVRMSYGDKYRVSRQIVGESELYAFTYEGEDAAESTTITDAYGNKTVHEHDEEGRQSRIIHPDGTFEVFEHDEHNSRTRYLDPAGGEYSYTYDDNGNMLTLDGPLGMHLEHTYNDANLVVSTTEKVDAVTTRSFTFDYDDDGNLTRFCLPLGDCGTISYDDRGQPLDMTDLRGYTTTNSYDFEGDLITVTNPEGATTRFDHDDLGRVISKTKPLGNGFTYTYDANSNLTDVDGPLDYHVGYEYDADNHLIRSTDPNGGLSNYTWTPSGKLGKAFNQLGFVTAFEYGLMNERIGMIDAEGRRWNYVYDNMLRVSDINGPLGVRQSFIYNPLGLVTLSTDAEGTAKYVEYDALGRALSVTRNYLPGAGEGSDTNLTTVFTYDLLGNRLSVTDPEGYTFTSAYDLQNRLVSKRDAEGYGWEYDYDPMGNLLSVLNPRGFATSYAYTATNRLQAITNPEQHVLAMAYDANGHLAMVTDPKQTVTGYGYDQLDRRVNQTKNYQPGRNPDSETNVTTDFTYDAAGNLRYLTNPLGHTAEIRYDAAHRRTEMINFEGGATRFEYDRVNNLLRVVDAEGNATAYTVDDLDRLIAVTNAEDETTRYSYDLVGNRTQLIEADATVTLYEFDGVYRLNRVHENYRPGETPGNDVNVVTSYGYDRRGLLTSIINGNQAETRFEHNPVRQLVREIDPLGKTWQYGYDGNRNRISRTDANGALTEYGFYPDDMLHTIDYADGAGVVYQYDANNNRIAMEDGLGETTWSFDPLNRITAQNDPFARVLSYRYDAASNRVGMTYPDGNQVSYEYSPNNWLKTMIDPAGQGIDYSRDLVGNITHIANPNQTETTIAYDKVYRTLERINFQNTQGGKVNSGFSYTYNEVGHVTEVVNEYGWRKPSIVTETYGYDGLHRLNEVVMDPLKNNSDPVHTRYEYDPVGNRLAWESTDDLQTSTPFDGFQRTYGYNAANQMLYADYQGEKNNDNHSLDFSYDNNGNRINRTKTTAHKPIHGVDYSYDAENRLILAQDYQVEGNNNRIERAFTTLEYDGGGRRLVKHYDPKNGGNGVDKRDEYVFDGLDPVAEYNMLNGQRTDYYRGAGNHLAMMHNYKGGTQGQMYWYHYNNKSDVVGLTKQNGNSHHNYRYDPYGAVLPENGNFTDPHNHYTLTGKEYDENTGLVWFGARHYDPETGVWIGMDLYRGETHNPMSLQRYNFVGTNPVSFLDWYGFIFRESYQEKILLKQEISNLKADFSDVLRSIQMHDYYKPDAVDYIFDREGYNDWYLKYDDLNCKANSLANLIIEKNKRLEEVNRILREEDVTEADIYAIAKTAGAEGEGVFWGTAHEENVRAVAHVIVNRHIADYWWNVPLVDLASSWEFQVNIKSNKKDYVPTKAELDIVREVLYADDTDLTNTSVYFHAQNLPEGNDYSYIVTNTNSKGTTYSHYFYQNEQCPGGPDPVYGCK